MTEETAAAVSEVASSTSNPNDDIFDFTIQEWVAASLIVPHKDERSTNVKRRHQQEHVYRSKTTPTNWHRYLTLGRYALSGPDFDTLMNDKEVDALKLHCVIWYNYMFHVDRMMECPPKLEAWAIHRSKPYLTKHQINALTVDTELLDWDRYAKQQALSENWTQVQKKPNSKSTSSKKQTLLTPFVSAAKAEKSQSKPKTIPEETSEQSSSEKATSQISSTSKDASSAVSDGKMSVLIPSLNVPVCDGTYRVTFRLTVSGDQMVKYRNPDTMKDEIFTFLNDIFTDEDGSLYNWTHSDTDPPNTISKMTPQQVRQFISPSISIMPTLSKVVVPIRFGFVGQTPSQWRNKEKTKSTLEKFKATVSFSNSTTTSGKLAVAGYILLKAPMTTHRLRYLQSLRNALPKNTPPFDILLHKRTPTDQLMPHLVAQCGESHVHSLSEALATILTGVQSALFIPRFVFERMSADEASTLFASHDSYVKALNWLPLSPLLSNLDRVRKEHNADGTVTERTTREWARNIRTLDGSEYAQCDVVNGGTDQLCYLLFPPKDKEAAEKALEAYRRRLYPFTQREAKFREDVGPPPVIQYSKQVIANLDFIKRLSTSETTQEDKTDIQPDNQANSASQGSSVSSVSQGSSPPSQGESIRKRTRDDDKSQVESPATDNSSVSTTESTVTETTKQTGRLSTSSAKFRELDAILQRQKQEAEQAASKASDRISTIERQLYRINDMDQKLSEVQDDIARRFTIFEDRLLDTMKAQLGQSGTNMALMESRMAQILSFVEVMNNKSSSNDSEDAMQESDTELAITAPIDDTNTLSNSESTSCDGNISRASKESRSSASSSGGDSMDAESICLIQSPEHKRQRSNGKKKLHESICRNLDLQKFSKSTSTREHVVNSSDLEADNADRIYSTSPTPTNSISSVAELSICQPSTPNSKGSLSRKANRKAKRNAQVTATGEPSSTTTDQQNSENSDATSNTNEELETDLESQYNANISPRRGSPS
jgi:hypothetical protein